MALTEAERQSIRDVEVFRHEVRSELAGSKAPPTLLEQVAGFFETKAGFWILTTVVAGAAVTGFSAIDQMIHRQEIDKQLAAEQSRRDTDTLLKLGPMLTSEHANQRDVAIVLLNGLALNNAIDTNTADQVKALFQSTTDNGSKQDATPQEKAQANSILAFVDRARVANLQSADPTGAAAAPATPISSALDTASFPARVYIQVARAQDKTPAEATAKALRASGLLVPGIELVAPNRVPGQNDLRYCKDKTDDATVARVSEAVARLVSPPPKVVPLNPKVCTKVRTNHFELWFAPVG